MLQICLIKKSTRYEQSLIGDLAGRYQSKSDILPEDINPNQIFCRKISTQIRYLAERYQPKSDILPEDITPNQIFGRPSKKSNNHTN